MLHEESTETKGRISLSIIQKLGMMMMRVLGVTDHKVAGKLLEMTHWHSHEYAAHRPVGVFWLGKEGEGHQK